MIVGIGLIVLALAWAVWSVLEAVWLLAVDEEFKP